MLVCSHVAAPRLTSLTSPLHPGVRIRQEHVVADPSKHTRGMRRAGVIAARTRKSCTLWQPFLACCPACSCPPTHQTVSLPNQSPSSAPAYLSRAEAKTISASASVSVFVSLSIVGGSLQFQCFEDLESVDHFAEDDVLAIEPCRRCQRHEKLRLVRVGALHTHARARARTHTHTHAHEQTARRCEQTARVGPGRAERKRSTVSATDWRGASKAWAADARDGGVMRRCPYTYTYRRCRVWQPDRGEGW